MYLFTYSIISIVKRHGFEFQEDITYSNNHHDHKHDHDLDYNQNANAKQHKKWQMTKGQEGQSMNVNHYYFAIKIWIVAGGSWAGAWVTLKVKVTKRKSAINKAVAIIIISITLNLMYGRLKVGQRGPDLQKAKPRCAESWRSSCKKEMLHMYLSKLFASSIQLVSPLNHNYHPDPNPDGSGTWQRKESASPRSKHWEASRFLEHIGTSPSRAPA